MKISIITVSFNSEKTIEDTILSVIEQDYNDIEHIIIDGDSTDKTIDILRKYEDHLAQVRSESDDGIYEAINKGIRLATGEIVGILNSDDVYESKNVLTKIAVQFKASGADTVYGDLVYVKRDDLKKVVRYWRSKPYKHGMFNRGWMLPHPTFYVKRSVYKKFGYYNTEMRSASDYEFMLRILHKHKVSTSYLPMLLVRMRIGGISNVTLENRIRANKEDAMAWEINGLQKGRFTLLMKPLRKLIQFLGRPR